MAVLRKVVKISTRADRLLFTLPPPTKETVGVFTIEKLATYQ